MGREKTSGYRTFKLEERNQYFKEDKSHLLRQKNQEKNGDICYLCIDRISLNFALIRLFGDNCFLRF